MLRAEVPPYVSEYVDYVSSLLRSYSSKGRLVVLGPIPAPPQAFRVGINFEHTLVRSGGRDIEGAPLGIVSSLGPQRERYHVRLVNKEFLSVCDVVIDYSMPNIFHVRSSRHYPHIAEHHVYIAPCLYPIVWTRTKRKIDVLTTFLDTEQSRRKKLLQDANGLITNVSDCFAKDEICRLYQSAKVMINIHQTPDHHTFEELRALPALENGVLVIAEESPLKDLVPYHSMVIWAPYDQILEVARDAVLHYDSVWAQTFTPKNRVLLESLHSQNESSLRLHMQRNVH
jgi:hypothetical protein